VSGTFAAPSMPNRRRLQCGPLGAGRPWRHHNMNRAPAEKRNSLSTWPLKIAMR